MGEGLAHDRREPANMGSELVHVKKRVTNSPKKEERERNSHVRRAKIETSVRTDVSYHSARRPK